MGCNCGTKEEIDKLYRIYGEKTSRHEGMTFSEKIKHALSVSFTVLCWIVIFPVMLVYMFLFLFWNEPGKRTIDVRKFNLLKIFHLGKYDNE